MMLWLTSQYSWILNRNKKQAPPFQLSQFSMQNNCINCEDSSHCKGIKSKQYHKDNKKLIPCVFSWVYILSLRYLYIQSGIIYENKLFRVKRTVFIEVIWHGRQQNVFLLIRLFFFNLVRSKLSHQMTVLLVSLLMSQAWRFCRVLKLFYISM